MGEHTTDTTPRGDGGTSDLPLTGIRVLDLSRILAGPYCTMMLGDLGAEVIKVERPGTGDDTRTWGPPFAGGESAYYLCCNRNKKSIVVDLKNPRGVGLVKELAKVSDVLVENFTPGLMKRFGLDDDTLSMLNPRLVHCSITAYGQDGPYRDRPGYDMVLSAVGGLMWITGPRGGEPCKVGVRLVLETPDRRRHGFRRVVTRHDDRHVRRAARVGRSPTLRPARSGARPSGTCRRRVTVLGHFHPSASRPTVCNRTTSNHTRAFYV